jgi:hypothetical protein
MRLAVSATLREAAKHQLWRRKEAEMTGNTIPLLIIAKITSTSRSLLLIHP